MRNSLAVLLLILAASPLMAQNGGTGRENWFPNRGNVGVGTRTPSKDLEVIGDIKVSGITFTQMLEAISVKSGTISVSGNGLISGNLGLGVANPTERLDVLGNIKLSGNLSAQELVIQTLNANSGQLNSLSVNQDAFFGGKVGIGITATEKLHVNGNLKVSDMTFTSGLTASSISTGELNSAGKIVGSTMEVGSAEVTETLRAAGIFATERLEVAGPISVQDITVSGSLASNSISVGSNLSVTGATNLAGGATIGGMLNLQNVAVSNTFTGNSLVAADIQATNSLAVGQNLTVHSNGQIDGNFSVGGQLNANALAL